jgi:hypothetical protein
MEKVISSGNITNIKLDGIIGFIPNIQTIKEGDEVVWENFDPVTIILVSNDGFFDDKLLSYYQQFNYIFSKSGNYTFFIKNTNLTGNIIVESPMIAVSPEITESPANQTPAPSVTTSKELPKNALYVIARMNKLSNWSTANETKYQLGTLKVNVINQINIPLTIKAQIFSDDQILEEKTFTLQQEDSNVEFSNEQNHFINNRSVNLRLLIQGYLPIEYKFIEVNQLN